MDKKALAALAATPVTRANNSAAKVWKLTEKGVAEGATVGGQPGVILRALAALEGEASSTAIVEMVNRMREEDETVEAIMAGTADQGTATIVAHYSGTNTMLRKKGLVE